MNSSFSTSDVISILTPLLPPPPAICHPHVDPFSKTYSDCSVIQSVWLYIILVLVHYHRRNTSIQKRVNFLKVKVTMTLTQKQTIFASAVSLNRLFTSYSKDKREKEAKYWSLRQKVKGQPYCNSLVALYFLKEYLYAFKSQMHLTL